MSSTSAYSLSDRFDWWIECLFKALTLYGYRRAIGGPVGTAITLRMFSFRKRLRTVLAKWRAGTLVAAPGRSSDSTPHPGPPPQGGREKKVRAKSVLPRGFGWLRKMIPEIQEFTGGLWYLLTSDEMKAMLATAPQVGRIFRPLAWMMGTALPPELQLPKRVRRDPEVAHPSPDPSLKGRGKRRTPQEIAKAAIEKALRTGKPVDPRKMSAAAYGCVLHMPRDEHCPPPEIGYGGRAFPNTPKDYVPPKDWE